MTAPAFTPVPLEPPYSRGNSDPDNYVGVVALESGPLLARTGGCSRWHRVRSAVLNTQQSRMAQFHAGEWTHLSYWCGAGGAVIEPGSPREALLADTLPDHEPLCGPCEGRAIGAGYPPAALALVDGAALRFDPASRFRIPPVCPAAGSRSRMRGLYALDTSARNFPCPACGDLVRWWGDGIERHEPGDGLVAPCPFHRWDELVTHPDGAVRCRCRG